VTFEAELEFAFSGRSLTFIVTFRGAYLSSVLCDEELKFDLTISEEEVIVVDDEMVDKVTCVAAIFGVMFSWPISFGDALPTVPVTTNGVVLLAARTAARSWRYVLNAGVSFSLSNILEPPLEPIMVEVLLMKDRTDADSVTGLKMSADRSLIEFGIKELEETNDMREGVEEIELDVL